MTRNEYDTQLQTAAANSLYNGSMLRISTMV